MSEKCPGTFAQLGQHSRGRLQSSLAPQNGRAWDKFSSAQGLRPAFNACGNGINLAGTRIAMREPMTLRTREQFEWLLGHELMVAARHRHFVTVVMVASCEGGIGVLQLLRETLRSCDGCLEENGKGAVLMVHTTAEQARSAISRFKGRCSNLIDFRYSIVSYPQDAAMACDLMDICEARLERARRAGFGAVVAGESARSTNEKVL